MNPESINFINALTNPLYSNWNYEVDLKDNYPGKLYLNDNENRHIEVIFERDGLPDYYYKDSIHHFLEDIKNHPTSPLNRAVIDLANENFEKKGDHLEENLQVYYKHLGMPKIHFSNETLLQLINESRNISDVYRLSLCILPSGLDRKIFAETLKNQEDQILEKCPEDPTKLRAHFENLLAEKNTTYEEVVQLCDWSQGVPAKNMPEDGYVLAKLIAQVDAWEALGYKDFPFTELWRFFIDDSKEKFGPYYFENEPFYMLSSLRGFKEILESKEALSQETYEKYAHLLTRNPPVMKDTRGFQWDSNSLVKDEGNIFFTAKMVNKGQSFDGRSWKRDDIGLDDLETRTKAYEEAKQRGPITDDDYWTINATGFEYKFGYEIYAVTNTTPSLITSRISHGLQTLLDKAKTPGERLIAYIWAARELELTHQLEDGNGRTSIATLVKRIIDDKDLPPYMPEDPNILDQQGPEQLIRDIHSGMCRFQALSGKNPSEIISVDELIDQAGVRGQKWDIIHERGKLDSSLISKLVEEDKSKYMAK